MKLLLWGAGAHGHVIHDLALACGYTDIAFADDRLQGTTVCGSPVLSSGDHRLPSYEKFIICLGDNRVRSLRFEEAKTRGLNPAVLIHPSAVVSRSAVVGPGTMVLPMVVIGGGSSVGSDCILNTACVVEHDSEVGDHTHIGPGAIIGGEVIVESFAQAGMGARVLSRLRLGEGALLGAGAVAVCDIAPGWVATGIPARPKREVAAA